MEKLKELVRKRSSKSLHRTSRSFDQRPDSSNSEDTPRTKTLEAYHPASDKDLPPVPPLDTAAAHQAGSSTPLRPSSQWGKAAQEHSPLQQGYQQSSPIAPASAVPKRKSSLMSKPAAPPHIEQDYDQYRTMLAEAATTGPQKGGDTDVFHDASEGVHAPGSRADQQKASRDYGRRQIQATHGNDLNMQGLSLADDDDNNNAGIGRASTDPVPMNEQNGNARSSTDPLANKQRATTRKALPPRPHENTVRHVPLDPALQDADQTQPQTPPRPSYLPTLDPHPKPTTTSTSTTSNANHTFSTSPHPDPLARLPPSFNPTNTIDTHVSTRIAPAVTHHTQHTRHVEIVQEAITRDIHVDHYYHYIQPLKVVEVKPAQDFRINSKGEKLSIAAPEGWEMPADLAVRRAPDFAGGEGGGAERLGESGVGGTGSGKGSGSAKLGWGRRDYVVDEENPDGRLLEPEELERERALGHLASPVGVMSGSGSGHASAASSPVRDSKPGLAR